MELYYQRPFDCENRNDEIWTTAHDRACANLKLQKSDSILTVVYDSLLLEMQPFGGDSLVYNFVGMQTSWRDFRAAHCKAIWDDYEDCGGCNTRAAHFMACMREVTDLRTDELRKLLLFCRERKGGRYGP